MAINLKDLEILATSIRDLLSSYGMSNNIKGRAIFNRNTLRNIARALEKDNIYFKTLKEKQNRMRYLIENDPNYFRFSEVVIDRYNESFVLAYKKLDEIFTTKYSNLPLHINDSNMDDFTTIILKWRLKIGK